MQSQPFVDDGFPERWAAWQARVSASRCALRRKLFAIAALLAVSVAVLYGVWSY
jgi:hypothetical protein